ncbi:MAG: hypothetical protein WAN61_01780 [Minisyncoccia bacterium]
MKENPPEQQIIEIEVLRRQTRDKFGQLFDDRDQLNDTIDRFISQLEIFQKNGLVFDKEKIINELKEGIKIKDRDEFTAHFLKVLEPILMLKVMQPKIFGVAEREIILNQEGNLELSEVLYTSKDELNNENEKIFFHLPPSVDFMTKKKVEEFKQEIEKGLIKLAELIKPFPNIKEVWASSWIIATPHGRKRLEDLGFTFAGMVPDEENDANFFDKHGRKRPFAKAFMKREDFLTRYGKKE